MELADPERALAVAYAPAQARAGLTALFALDERFGQVVSSTTEPMIGLMRLAWWREALEKLDRDPAPAEPLLRLLADHVLPNRVTGAKLAAIEDGWTALIDGDADADAIARHGRERGRNLFMAAAAILDADAIRLAGAGEIWALVDLGYRHSDAQVRATARAQANRLIGAIPREPWPKAARPLAALLALAIGDARTDKRIQGSPSRLLRMLALRLTGR
ncbi:MAG TPA: squalene/phytoene synthase family protein [Sphingomonas sp.]|uniref:squalene/phytoene synthase family protein n=1 Tax=Sphingomonas sp. TaxID=28214 RepID=UPI002CE06101|nr:squalene/phytoene synthase family protein [Sphingomonas sp.]HMI19887.1 squalene/phytoene synthase family protein [Sphingomonas sp.]